MKGQLLTGEKEGTLVYKCHGQHLHLLKERAIYWQEEEMLFLADLHFGKVNHFRKAGIPIPASLVSKDLDVLSRLCDTWQPRMVSFLGDLFHSYKNKEWDLFYNWRSAYSDSKVELIRGNHDIIPAVYYKQADVKVYPLCVEKGPFIFAHEPLKEKKEGLYAFAGHVHPAVNLYGAARQSLTLPCFYFGRGQVLLPAFGQFNGHCVIRPLRQEKVFVVTAERVMDVSASE